MNIEKNCYTISDVAQYLGISPNQLCVLYAKDKNNVQKGYHEFYESTKHPSTGETLNSTKGYYISNGSNQECVYAEYASASGQSFCYVKHPGQSVSKQIHSDQNEIKSNISNHGGEKSMSDLTKVDLRDLENFRDSLEEFRKVITHQCDKMESGISFGKSYMKDEQSDKLLKKCSGTVMEIRACLNPTNKLYTKVLDAIEVLKKDDLLF